MNNWTDEQKTILDASGNVLVYASAGSGKTSVMVKKIADDVINGIPVEDILVLSYTNASAADMRFKIVNALYESVKDASDKDADTIRKQLDSLPFSEIGTMDSFLGRLIKENFEFLGISPDASQMDEGEASEMKARAMSAVLKNEYAAARDDFLRVASHSSNIADDAPLSQTVYDIYEAISINPRPDEFKKLLLDSVTDNPDSLYGKVILDYYRELAEESLPFARRIKDEVNLSEAPGYAKSLDGAIDALEKISKISSVKEAETVVGLISDPGLTGHGKNKLSDEDKKLVKLVRDRAYAEVAKGLANGLFVDYDGYNVNDAREFMNVVLRLTEEFADEYGRLKLSENKLDFNDLSRYAVKLLSDEKRAESVGKKFSLVFVDEYQDINPLQEEILQRISRGNLFMVGDVKQSIYAFRNADSKIFTDKKYLFEQDESDGKALPMTRNFRSDRELLRFFDRVFSAVMSTARGGCDYKKESLFLKDDFSDDFGGKAAFMVCENVRTDEERETKGVYSVKNHVSALSGEEKNGYAEGLAIAAKIKELIGSRYVKKDGSPLLYSDIAILFKKRKSGAEGLLKALENAGIPFISDGFSESAGKKFVKELTCLMKAVDNVYDDVAFTGYLLSYFGKMNETDLQTLISDAPRGYVYDAVKIKSEENSALGEKCLNAVNFLNEARNRASNLNAEGFLKEFIGITGFDAYAMAGGNGADDYRAVRDFADAAADVGDGGVAEFIAYLKNKPDERSKNVPDGGGNAVRVMTVHASKGLQFPVVFAARCDAVARNSEASSDIVFDRALGAGVKLFNEETRTKMPSLAYTAITLDKKRRASDENIRLFYVALTRAENRIYLTGTVKGDLSGKTDFPTPIIASSSFADLMFYAAAADDAIKRTVTPCEPARVELSADTPVVLFGKGDENIVKSIKKVTEFSYPFSKSSSVGRKYTVTEINREQDEFTADVFTPSLSPEDDNRKKGIAYHTVMENVDYSFTTVSEIDEMILSLEQKGILTPDEAAAVDARDILGCISHPVMREGVKGKYVREKSFMLTLSATEVGGDPSDDILVQGTPDVVFFGKENVICDFKYSGLPDDKLAQKYKNQLKLYKLAVEKAYNVKIDRLLLYSFKSRRFVEVSP